MSRKKDYLNSEPLAVAAELGGKPTGAVPGNGAAAVEGGAGKAGTAVPGNADSFSFAGLRDIVARQRAFVSEGLCSPYLVRLAKLNALELAVEKNEKAILDAYVADLGRNARDVWTSEIGQIRTEIRTARKNLRRWMAPRPVALELYLQPASAWKRQEPLGTVLILSPWNYPALLSIVPLVGALAAGNSAVLKLSERVPAISRALATMIGDWFEPEAVAAVEGGPDIAAGLTRLEFDLIFFTGSTATGKRVAQAAAERLVPVVLELGGKSPAIVDSTADLESAAAKIVWGRFFAAGQTCIAPDHVFVEGRERAEEFLAAAGCALERFWGGDRLANPACSQLVDVAHAARIAGLVDDARTRSELVIGGRYDVAGRRCEPTLVLNPRPEALVMNEEIFGPILPVICVEDCYEAGEAIMKRPKPLAAYMFTSSNRRAKWFLESISAGGAGINSVLLHAGSTRLPFGGVGQSGIGRYHGYAGFLAFSNIKSVVRKSPLLDPNLELPDSRISLKTIKRFFG